ncbi:hypothetical protein EX30DRAFT_337351 [Ascodesmis nigricans]|uniref:Actin-like ATPase domain-containing protein n=1 Tax=Ascodesmis nigricans TaxID=341454 RepID=A0A4S2N6U9_9PEZI|nr:hypothetical protein EX30DRAFT_337351 [Ascodesmis nigricans]
MSTTDTRDRSSLNPSTPTPTTYHGAPPSIRAPSLSSSANATSLRYTSGLSSHGIAEDPLVLEIGTKFLRAGLANQEHPRCVLAWDKRMFKRCGDRALLDDIVKRRGTELWTADMRGLDIGLVEDLLERGVREAYHKYLLIDSKTKKLIIPVPPLFPTKLLTSIIATLFSHFQPPSIALLPSPVLATVAAGLRCALVVDIGWYETVVTPVYDLRPIEGRGIGVYGRSKRAVQCLRKQWVRLLTPHYRRAMGVNTAPSSSSTSRDTLPIDPDSDDESEKVSKIFPNLNDVSEAMERLGWCRPLSTPLPAEHTYRLTKIPLPSSGTSITLPFSDLALPAERAFFAPTTEDVGPGDPVQRPFSPLFSHDSGGAPTNTIPTSAPEGYPDDDDFPLPRLLYNVLMRCTVEVRAACLKRIVFIGGGSRIPGLQTRTLEELQVLVDTLKWDVSPEARLEKTKTVVSESGAIHSEIEREGFPQTRDEGESQFSAHESEEEQPYDWHIHGISPLSISPRSTFPRSASLNHRGLHSSSDKNNGTQPARESKKSKEIYGEAKAVKSLGVWVGGSLLGGQRIQGNAVIEREKFLKEVAAGGTGIPSHALQNDIGPSLNQKKTGDGAHKIGIR